MSETREEHLDAFEYEVRRLLICLVALEHEESGLKTRSDYFERILRFGGWERFHKAIGTMKTALNVAQCEAIEIFQAAVGVAKEKGLSELLSERIKEDDLLTDEMKAIYFRYSELPLPEMKGGE